MMWESWTITRVLYPVYINFFFFSSRRRHTRFKCDWSSDVCSSDLIDALLMAFPALGLAKIVWAADVILAMDLPEFRIENLDAKPDWHDLLAADAAANDEVTHADCKGRSLFIYRKGAEYRVYDSRCPPQG